MRWTWIIVWNGVRFNVHVIAVAKPGKNKWVVVLFRDSSVWTPVGSNGKAPVGSVGQAPRSWRDYFIYGSDSMTGISACSDLSKVLIKWFTIIFERPFVWNYQRPYPLYRLNRGGRIGRDVRPSQWQRSRPCFPSASSPKFSPFSPCCSHFSHDFPSSNFFYEASCFIVIM
jgi:hypothetical protein